jgi:DNA repair exonuclease SbcCD ATPase subunit
MKIKLRNFRCWKDKEIETIDEGLVLITGPSGRGKTSLLNAIFFALYGIGTKVTHFGCSSCSVELEFGPFLIKRSRRPNRLVLEIGKDGLYEDATAQNIINEKFGKAFDITSYVQQDTYRSFVLLSPLEKLAFLEKILFQNVDIKEIKSKTKDLLKHRTDDFSRKRGKLEMAEGLLEDAKKPEEVSFPLKGRNRELAMKNERIRHKNCATRIKKLEQDLISLQQELMDRKVLESFTVSKSEGLVRLEDRLALEKKEFEECGYRGDDALRMLEKGLEKMVCGRELRTLKDQYQKQIQDYEDIISQESEVRNSRIGEIREQLWHEMDKDECKGFVRDHKQYLQDIIRVEKLREGYERKECKDDERDFEKIKEEIEKTKRDLESLTTTYSCPNCETILKLDEGELVGIDSPVSNSSEELEEKLRGLEKRKENLEYRMRIEKEIEDITNFYEDFYDVPKREIEEDLTHWEGYLERNLELEKEMTRLKDQGMSQSARILKRNLDKQEQQIRRLEERGSKSLDETLQNLSLDDEDNDKTEEDIRKELNTQREKRIIFRRLESSMAELENNIEVWRFQLVEALQNHLTKYPELRYSLDIEKIVRETQERIAKETEDMEKHRRNLVLVEEHRKYVSDLKAYQEKQNRVSRYERECRVAKEKMAAADLMKTKINEAEAIAISNMIRSINTHASMYLDLFFEEPISVTLLPFKRNQKKQEKPQINIRVDYKGMETEISPLSGGEKDRIILAYALAFSEMNNSPFLLLDECIKSLDSSLAAKVVTAIKHNYVGALSNQSGKLVILIAHQIVRGLFNEVIDV